MIRTFADKLYSYYVKLIVFGMFFLDVSGIKWIRIIIIRRKVFPMVPLALSQLFTTQTVIKVDFYRT